MPGKENQPDWGKIAEKFDLWLPQIAPVGDALIAALNAQAGDRILDIASGTGEPALTLARRMGDNINILGVDAAEGMVNVAQNKVRKEKLSNIEFKVMPAEQLSFADNSFERVLCRFGVMLFQNPAKGVNEMYRVLKPGGAFALAVWGTAESMRTMKWTYDVFMDRIPSELYPPLPKVTSMGIPGAIDELLDSAGFSRYTVEQHELMYEFSSFDEYWDLVEASDIMKMQFDAIPAEEKRNVRDEVRQFAEEFITKSGFRVPHEYLLVSGNK